MYLWIKYQIMFILIAYNNYDIKLDIASGIGHYDLIF